MDQRLAGRMKARFAHRFGDEIRFFKGWLNSPKGVGSVTPTSQVLARRMASMIDASTGLPVLELGPGTGVITRAILARGVKPQNLTCIEHSAEFAAVLRRSFRDVTIIEGDAFDLDGALKDGGATRFDCVVSALPLLSFPKAMRAHLMLDLLARLPHGRPVVQFSYGPLSPVPALPGVKARHLDFVVRNVPPAQIWLYTAATPT
jgi:phosphatidylethanolamine/phosphatidyl-N-methylethanolamine N-methyltransferase